MHNGLDTHFFGEEVFLYVLSRGEVFQFAFTVSQVPCGFFSEEVPEQGIIAAEGGCQPLEKQNCFDSSSSGISSITVLLVGRTDCTP